MTDFIHEPKKEPSAEQKSAYTPPATEKERAKRVYLYSVILFAAAFLLILWSFLAGRSSDQQVLDALKNNTDVLQGSIKENAAQEKQIAVLEAHIADLEDRLRESQEKHLDTLASLRALDYLHEMERTHALGDEDAARELMRAFEKEDLAASLPTEPLRDAAEGEENPSPAERYEALAAELSANEAN